MLTATGWLVPQLKVEVMAANAFWRTLTRFDHSKIATEIAFRNTAGFIAAFVIGTALDSPTVGVLAGLGALNVAYSDSRDPYIIRARRMLLSAVLSGLAVALGGLSGQSNVTAVVAATAWAFGSGMLVALGSIAGDLGVITLVTLVVFAARPLSSLEALQSGLVALGGGLLQTLLAIAWWPVGRYQPERRIVGTLYRSLAAMARASTSPLTAPPLSAQISDAHEKLAELHRDHGEEAERLALLLNQAERIRLSVLTLGRLAQRMLRGPAEEEASAAVMSTLDSAAAMLESIAWCALDGKRPQDIHRLVIPAELQSSPDAHHSVFRAAILLDARQQVDALGGQIRAAAEAALPEGQEPALYLPPETFRARVQDRAAKLRANFSLHSTVFRHAVRLAVCLGVGDALGRSLGLERSYWIPMTIAIVLKPDFTATVTRGILRLAGTYAGLLLATALFHFTHTGVATDVALMAAFTFLLRWVGPANYGIFVTALSSMIVLLIATTGAPPQEVIVARALNTSVGGLLAMFAYFIWPTWEKTSVGATLADLLDSYRTYFSLVIAAYEEKATASIDAVRIAGRRARSNAEASIDRLAAEPRVGTARLSALNALLVNSHSFVHAVMALEAGLHRTSLAAPRAETMAFAAQVEQTLSAFAGALRNNAPLVHLPDLRAAHNLVLGSNAPATARYTLVNTETDRIVTSLNTLGEHIAIAREE